MHKFIGPGAAAGNGQGAAEDGAASISASSIPLKFADMFFEKLHEPCLFARNPVR